MKRREFLRLSLSTAAVATLSSQARADASLKEIRIGYQKNGVLVMQLSSRTAALAYWQGQYIAIDQNEDAIRLAEVSLPVPRLLRQI